MATGTLVMTDGREGYRIDGVEQMDPFLMTVVSDTDLWMFVTSTGALTAGRVDADHALFPYETDDRLYRAAEVIGPVTVIARQHDDVRQLWRPFGREVTAGCTRAITKSVLGDRVTFEERHPGWGLVIRATWAPSDAHGWVRTVELVDTGDGDGDYEVLDGLLDVMPAGVDAHTEQVRSNLVDAYKRSETGPWGTVAVYGLESLVTDRAEPMEALTATTVWSWGLDGATVDLDHRAVGDMVDGVSRQPTTLLTGRPGAYLLRGPVTVDPAGVAGWAMVADTDLGHADVVTTVDVAADPAAPGRVRSDVAAGSDRLHGLLADADGAQSTGDAMADAHHLSNVLFNSMRGGVFPFGAMVPTTSLASFVADWNTDVRTRHDDWFRGLDDEVEVTQLRAAAADVGDPDLLRLVLEYLPLTFSRRHGDPSRPWNRFSISVRDDLGNQVLAYEGNWRDIFQNWEALLQSYPAYLVNVVAKFLNASTLDGFNPYRISDAGIDWEVPDPEDPWSHIGYWGDHQIVYLLRLLETWVDHEPGAIEDWLDRAVFAFADVPYRLATHDEMVADPRDTITYDHERADEVADRVARRGADGRLVTGDDDQVVRVGMFEKLLVTALAKLSSYVPDGGIWLNTQRPEWNDANNALAGPGLSMVTLFHLRRYLVFLRDLVGDGDGSRAVSSTVARWCRDVTTVLADVTIGDDGRHDLDDHDRRRILDALGARAQAHRERARSVEELAPEAVSLEDLRGLCDTALVTLDASIAAGHRDDGLFHSYNRVSFTDDTARVDHLGPMLEGQVAVLSSGVLDGAATLDLVGALYDSAMYRPDQDTFMLYPATELPAFLDRNVVPDDAAARLRSLDVTDDHLATIVTTDADATMRFRPGLVNAKALTDVLDGTDLSDQDRATVADVYEQVFDHASFTGRSGSMYGYEGLGSVYWHMVAKLVVALQEAWWTAIDAGDADQVVADLAEAYRRAREGLGFTKDPDTFGAFPTDCYSHTPAHAGAQQPGMTGQVKEEVLTRFAELGIRVVEGRITLVPGLLAPDDVLVDDDGSDVARLTLCAVPVEVRTGTVDGVDVERADGTSVHHDGLVVPTGPAREVFRRTGVVTGITWTVGDATRRRWSSRT